MTHPIGASIDNLLFLLLLAGAGLLRLLASKAGGNREKDDSSTRAPRPTQMTTPPSHRTMTPVERAPGESDADRIRKFLEALGQPPSSTPPPPVRPRETPPPLPQAETARPEVARPGEWKRNILNPLPPVVTVPPPVRQPRRVVVPHQPQSKPVRVAPPVPIEPAAATHEAQEAALQKVFAQSAPDAYAVVSHARVSPPAKTELAKLLSSPEGLRQAMILREVLGPPRGLQPLDLVGV